MPYKYLIHYAQDPCNIYTKSLRHKHMENNIERVTCSVCKKIYNAKEYGYKSSSKRHEVHYSLSECHLAKNNGIITDDINKVTCKLCLKRLEDHKGKTKNFYGMNGEEFIHIKHDKYYSSPKLYIVSLAFFTSAAKAKKAFKKNKVKFDSIKEMPD